MPEGEKWQRKETGEGDGRPWSPGSAVDGGHLVAAAGLEGVEEDGGHLAHLARGVTG